MLVDHLGRWRALCGRDHVAKWWATEAVDAFGAELDRRGLDEASPRVEAALVAAKKAAGQWCPRPSAVLAILDEESQAAKSETKGGGRPGCDACNDSRGFRTVAVRRPDGSYGTPFLLDCRCHSGRDPLSTPLSPRALPGSVLVYVATTPRASAEAEAQTDARLARIAARTPRAPAAPSLEGTDITRADLLRPSNWSGTRGPKGPDRYATERGAAVQRARGEAERARGPG